MKKVLVTGASGFVGRYLVSALKISDSDVYPVYRKSTGDKNEVIVPSIDSTTDWTNHLLGIDIVVHAAAIVHKMRPTLEDRKQFFEVNVAGTERLALEAIARGVKRFIYLSSIKVNGDFTDGKPFHRSDEHRPTDDYGMSKSLAEKKLLEICRTSDMELVILRPTLVYGPGVKANFLALVQLINRGIPLPFGAIKNRRSMVYVENLVDLISLCVNKKIIKPGVYLVSDSTSYSLKELIFEIANALQKNVRVFNLPDFFFRVGMKLPVLSGYMTRLVSNLEVNATETFSELEWKPPFALNYGIAETVKWFLEKKATPQQKKSLILYEYLGKRIIDSFFSSFLLVFFAPVFVITAIIIYLDNPGKILFIQPRAGRNHQPFKIYKFRTMKLGTPSISTEEMRKSGIDPITRVGRILRRTSLDELPQLINVIKGEMSLVGPRPALMSQTKVLEGRERTGSSGLLPGITGLAQALGRDDLEDDEKIAFDKTYAEKLSFGFDVYVCFLTVKALFSAKGAH